MNNDKKILRNIYNSLIDKFAKDVKIIDIKKTSTLSDYFIIASGNNENQIRAMSDTVIDNLQEINISLKKIEGYNNSSWILLDFGIAIVHIFNEEIRNYYNLEKVWASGNEIDIEALDD